MDPNDLPTETSRRDAALAIAATVVQAAPFVGGMIGQILSEIPRDRQRRQEQFLRELAQAVEGLGEHLDAEFVRTEEFAVMTEEVIEKGSRRRELAKREYYAAALANTAIHARPPEVSRDRMIAVLEQLSLPHLRLLALIDQTVKSPREEDLGAPIGGSVKQTLQELLPDVPIEVVKMEWEDLESQHLMQPYPAGMMSGGGAWNLRGHITDFGRQFLQFIRLPYGDVHPPE